MEKGRRFVSADDLDVEILFHIEKSIGLGTIFKHLSGTDHDHDQSSHSGTGGTHITTANDIARDSFTAEEQDRLYKLQTATNDLQKSFGIDSSGNKASSQALLYERLKDNKDFIDALDPVQRVMYDSNLDRSGVIKERIRGLVDNWSGTSGDTNPNSIAMQMAVRDEFGVKDSWVPHSTDDVNSLPSSVERGDING
jgi:hypothetical protein